MALTQISTDGIKNGTITGTDLATSFATTGDFTFTGETSGYNAVWDKSDNALEFAENAKAKFGATLTIYKSSSHAIIDNEFETGSYLRIGSANGVIIGSPLSHNQVMIRGYVNGAAELYFSGTRKLATTTNGCSLQGAQQDLQGDVKFDNQANPGMDLRWDESLNRLHFEQDNIKAVFGTSSDFEIYHDGSTNVINGLYHPIELRHQSEVHIKCVDDGAVELYHNNVKKFETTSAGVEITGTGTNTVEINGNGGHELYSYHDSAGVGWATGTGESGNYGELIYLAETGSQIQFYTGGSLRQKVLSTGIEVTGQISATSHIDIPDSGKLLLGTGDDLQIFHNGSGSFIDAYTTDLEIRNHASELMAEFRLNNAVDLYYDGTKRLSTHSQGAIVNGHTLYIRGASGEDARLFFIANNSTSYNDHYSLNVAATGAFAIQTEVNANQFENLITATQHGNVELYHDNSKKLETTTYGTLTAGESRADNFQVLDYDGSSTGLMKFGAGDDLKIFHDGTENFLNANSNVIIKTQTGENMAKFLVNGAVELYHDNFVRLSTKTDGITVTSEGNTPVVQWEGASNNAVGKIDCDQISPTQSHMRFHTENNGSLGERIRLKHNNAIMINTTSNPTVNAEGYINMIVDNGRDGVNIRHNHSGNCINLWRANGDGGLIHFYRGNTSQGSSVGSISVNSSSTNYGSGSDYRLKENVTPISDGITRLKTLKPSRFNFIADAETTVDGFLAHEVTAVPEAITGTKDEVDSKGNPVYQCIDQSKLVPLLVAAVQELIAKVEVLEAG